MFTTLGLFRNLSCPERQRCTRSNCVYSHLDELLPTKSDSLVSLLPSLSATTCGPSMSEAQGKTKESVIPAKRPAVASPSKVLHVFEPPRKLQKTGMVKKPVSVATTSHTESGVPILRINAARSQVAIPVRQTMLTSLFQHFTVLYQHLLQSNPLLASEHSLKQEQEVYDKSTKLTYRNAVIQCIAALKRRDIPTSLGHHSVGTEADIASRAEVQKTIQSLHLSADLLQSLIHSIDDLQKSGYIVKIPEGRGGETPSIEGEIAKCERCGQYFLVKRLEEAEECVYHWGKPYTTRINAEKTRIYTCCSKVVADGDGCTRGPHVFYESKPEELHTRHAFSFLLSSASSNSRLDVAALDCEMVYTTGGLRVARVSIVDGSGKEVLDELVCMDDGVNVIDYNTRFSGITAENYSTAKHTLGTLRKSLDTFIDVNTILIGHALDNDLKTLRIVHHKCVDTALLFPHKAGLPYRRSLKDLVREKLGKMIQIAAESGHSSAEDAAATLDLVRWFLLNKQKSAIQPGVSGVIL